MSADRDWRAERRLRARLSPAGRPRSAISVRRGYAGASAPRASAIDCLALKAGTASLAAEPHRMALGGGPDIPHRCRCVHQELAVPGLARRSASALMLVKEERTAASHAAATRSAHHRPAAAKSVPSSPE